MKLRVGLKEKDISSNACVCNHGIYTQKMHEGMIITEIWLWIGLFLVDRMWLDNSVCKNEMCKDLLLFGCYRLMLNQIDDQPSVLDGFCEHCHELMRFPEKHFKNNT